MKKFKQPSYGAHYQLFMKQTPDYEKEQMEIDESVSQTTSKYEEDQEDKETKMEDKKTKK